MFESKLNRGRAGGYAPLDGSGKVPLDKLPPIQSTIDTGSFATTGSNTFTGDQTISTIQGTGSLYLKPDFSDARYFQIYNTNPSDTHIKANGGFSFFGDDSNYLKIDDGAETITIQSHNDIRLETNSGDIIFNPDSGLYKGSANAGNALVTDSTLSNIIGDTDIVNNSTGNTITDNLARIANSISSGAATTGSNQFYGNQSISGSIIVSSSLVVSSTVVNSGSINALNSDLIIDGGDIILSGSLYFGSGSVISETSNSSINTPHLRIEVGGIPKSIGNIVSNSGGWDANQGTNISTTGGSGNGLTVDIVGDESGYISSITINTAGSGYRNGDIITATNDSSYTSFIIFVEAWEFDTSGSLTTPGDVIVSGSIYADNLVGLVSSSAQIAEFGGLTKNSGSWTVEPGTANYSFTLDSNNIYQIWVLGNIANGIISYNGMVNISNTNVPVIGSHNAWHYELGGALLFTSIPNQIVTTSGSISEVLPAGIGTNTNTFTFGISNTTEESAVVNYGYVKLS